LLNQKIGFGKKSAPKIVKAKVSNNGAKTFVGIDKPVVNNPSKPEMDDQGYTLYTNEETGEKKRVFEALVEYPSDFTVKIVGENVGSFRDEMVQVVADTCGVSMEEVRHSERTNGKWLSVTVIAPVESAEMVYTLYENLDRDPRVKFKF
jgi:putative lipoic acid-binding regulatory protein